MIKLKTDKTFNSYILESYDYKQTKEAIQSFAVANGFESNLVYNDTHPDITYIEYSNKKIPIADIRTKVVGTTFFSPRFANKKIYVIYDAVNLDVDTQNVLLKTLEEPKDFDIFFLVTTNASKLLEPIKSRCIIIRDDADIDYKRVLDLPYLDDALNILANLKYAHISDIMNFADNFSSKENNVRDLIMIYRCVLRDVFSYKKTLDKNLINLKEKEMEIITISNTLSFEDIGKLIDNLDKLSMSKDLNINKKIAVYNFFEV